MISSLEIVWPLSFHHPRNTAGKGSFRQEHYEMFLETLLNSFPALRYLYISLRAADGEYYISRNVKVKDILQRLDQVVLQMPNLVECGVGLTDTLFHHLLSQCKAHSRCKRNVAFKVWRFVDGECIMTESDLKIARPEPPSRSGETASTSTDKGYWVFKGSSDGMDLIEDTLANFRG